MWYMHYTTTTPAGWGGVGWRVEVSKITECCAVFTPEVSLWA